MRKFLYAALVAGAGILGSQSAGAVTLPAPAVSASPSITLVDGGCGPAFFRAPNGFCYRKPYAPPPPPVYYHRFCPPGFHPTPWGCRPNY